MSEYMRKINKPNIVVDDDVGLLAKDETMTNQEFASIFFNLAIFNETDGNIVFNSEVINKFKRFLVYQEKLDPLREKLVLLQFEKYFENTDVNKEKSEVVTISLFGESEMENITVYASNEDGEFVYIDIKAFKRMLKILEDNTIQYLRIPEEERFISLRIWAFDNNFEMTFSESKIQITGNMEMFEETEETEESLDEFVSKKANTRSKKANTRSKKDKSSNNEETEETQEENEAFTMSEYNAIFNTSFIESGEDIEIKPSLIEKLDKLISNMEAIKPMRELFAYHILKKFIEEDLHIEKFKTSKVSINGKIVSEMKVYELDEAVYVNLFSFKLILMRTGSYYAVYLKNDEEVLINLTRWVSENCGEIEVDENQLNITF